MTPEVTDVKKNTYKESAEYRSQKNINLSIAGPYKLLERIYSDYYTIYTYASVQMDTFANIFLTSTSIMSL